MELPWSELGRFCISQESELGPVYKCHQETHHPWDQELRVYGVSGAAPHFTGEEVGGRDVWMVGRSASLLGAEPGQEIHGFTS